MTYEYSWIAEIEIDSELGYLHEDGQPISVLKGLSRINVFVGPTSTGKSRLLRHLASLNNPMVWWGGNEHSKITPRLRKLAEQAKELIPIAEALEFTCNENRRAGAPANFAKEFKNISELGGLKPAGFGCSPLAIVGKGFGYNLQYLVRGIRDGLRYPHPSIDRSTHGLSRLEGYLQECEDFITDCSTILDGQLNWNAERNNGRYFVPALRLINTAHENSSKTFDFDKLIQDRYFGDLAEGQSAPTIWSGSVVYQKVRKLKDRDGQFEEFADYIARKVLGANSIKIDIENDSVFISIDDGKPRPIEHLGDGIMHLLVMILAFYDAQQKVVFIDEPEHGLHPGYIRTFFKAINEIKRESAKQFFIVTHSTQLLDALSDQSDASFFQFRRTQNGKNILRRIEWGDQEFIREIGVRPGSSMLVNATIWVEGVTDRQVYSRWLELYFEKQNKPYIEGVHYAITEYGGSNRDHWSFLDGENKIDLNSLCGPHMLILDQDSSSAKINDRNRVKAILRDRVVITPGRELENLLPEKLISEACRLWGCKELSAIKRASYKSKALGQFLTDSTDIEKKITGKNGGATLTNSYKRKLSDLECKTRTLDNFSDLDQDIFSELIEPIAKFVETMNS